MNLTKETIMSLIKEVTRSRSMLLEEPSVKETKNPKKLGKHKRVMEIIGPSKESFNGFGIQL